LDYNFGIRAHSSSTWNVQVPSLMSRLRARGAY
jgi:hypothetical protein